MPAITNLQGNAKDKKTFRSRLSGNRALCDESRIVAAQDTVNIGVVIALTGLRLL
jgi:hypothetical protein